MKVLYLIAAVVLSAVSFNVSAITTSTVGNVDKLIAMDDLSNSGTLSESQFFADTLNVDVSTVSITNLGDNSGGGNWLEVTDDAAGQDLWAFNLSGLSPGYFLIKTGENTVLKADGNVYDSYIYENLISFDYGVIDLEIFSKIAGFKLKAIDIDRISHVTVSGSTVVPEPSVLALLGLGLMSFGMVRRKV